MLNEKDEKIPAHPLGVLGVGGEHKIVETYAGDMAEVIENGREGLIKKIIHEEEGHKLETKNLSPQSKKNRLFMIIGILLIIFSFLTLFFFFFKTDINTVQIEQQFTPLIFNDKSIFLEIFGLKKDEIAQTVLSEINITKVQNGGVEGIYLTENKQPPAGIGLRRFLTLIKSSFIPGDNLLLAQDNFLMGVVNTLTETPTPPTRQDFFILLKVRSNLDIFDNLRAWEGRMLADLHGFLGINIDSDTKYLFEKDFQNEIIENKNARILYDKIGKIVLMYVFADDNSVIITNSQFAAREIMLRLASAKKKQ